MYDTLTISSLGLALSTQQLVFWTAVVLATVLGPSWIARQEGLDVARLRAAQGVLALFGLAGARLHFLFNNPHFYDAHPLHALLPWGGGMHMPGALIGLCLGAPIAARWHRLPIAKLGDGLVVVTALAYAGTRLGCFLGGCCFGSRCERPWAVTYPPGSLPFVIHREAGLIPADATASLPVHPAPIYFLLAAVVSAAVAHAVARRKRYDGQAFWAGLTLLAATAALVEPFRAFENHRVVWAGIPQLVWTELALALVGIVGLVASGLRHRQTEAPRPNGPGGMLHVARR